MSDAYEPPPPPPPSPSPSYSGGPSPDLPPAGVPPTRDERTYAVFIHVSTFLFPILGPLVLWLIRKDDSAYIDHHGKEAVNFHLTIFIAGFVFACAGFFCFLFLLPALALWLVSAIFSILAAVAANDGRLYRYPISIRMIT